jgi:hypothetical protein
VGVDIDQRQEVLISQIRDGRYFAVSGGVRECCDSVCCPLPDSRVKCPGAGSAASRESGFAHRCGVFLPVAALGAMLHGNTWRNR